MQEQVRTLPVFTVWGDWPYSYEGIELQKKNGNGVDDLTAKLIEVK